MPFPATSPAQILLQSCPLLFRFLSNMILNITPYVRYIVVRKVLLTYCPIPVQILSRSVHEHSPV